MKTQKGSAEKATRDIRRATSQQYSAKENTRILLEGQRGEASIAEQCSTEGTNKNLYNCWSKEFLDADKKRLPRESVLDASAEAVKGLRHEATKLTIVKKPPSYPATTRSARPNARG